MRKGFLKYQNNFLEQNFVFIFALFIAVYTLSYSQRVNAEDYRINMLVISDYEQLRPLFDACSDWEKLENIRNDIDLVSDLEDLRPSFEEYSFVDVHGCPFGIEGVGVELK